MAPPRGADLAGTPEARAAMLGCGPLLLGVAKVRVNQYAHDTLYDRYPAIYQQVSRLALETLAMPQR